MAEVTSSCPYCNAILAVPESSASSFICPRCKESIPLRLKEQGTSHSTRTPTVPAIEEFDQEIERSRQARQAHSLNSFKGIVVLGLVLGTLGVLTGLFISYNQRIHNSHQSSSDFETSRLVAPREMPGLGYLPAATDSVIALQVGPFLADWPDGNQADLHTSLLQMGAPEGLVTGFDRAIGVGLNNIDQIVIGLKLKEGSLLEQNVVVVHTHTSFAIADIADHAKALAVTKNERTFYRVPSTAQTPIEYYWWAPNDRVLIVALSLEQLEAVPREPQTNLAQMTDQTAKTIARRLPEKTYLWSVLDSDRWDQLAATMMLAAKRAVLTRREVQGLENIKRIVIAVNSDPSLSITVWFDLKSEKIGAAWRERLIHQFKDDNHVAVGGAGDIVMIRMPASTTALKTIFREVVLSEK